MARGPKHPYVGHFSGLPYPDGRVVGTTTWTAGIDAPLCDAILDIYSRHVPLYGALGPRGCGYQLKGQTIVDGKGVRRKIVKGNEGDAHALLPGERKADRLRRVVGADAVWTFDDVGELITLLRRNRSLPWAWVEDGRTQSRTPYVTHDLAGTLAVAAREFGADLLQGQPVKPVLQVEAAGGLAFWETIAGPWSVPVYSGSGQNPVDRARLIAEESLDHDLLVVLVTDFDLSGLNIADRLYEETMHHPHGTIEWVRLGVTDDQVRRLGLTRSAGQTKGVRSIPFTTESEEWTALHPGDAKDSFDRLMWSTLDIRQAARTRWMFRQERRTVLRRIGAAA